jgi:hypothetical protein
VNRIRPEALPRKAISLDENNWFYVEPAGLQLVHEILGSKADGRLFGKVVRTDQIVIPWRKVRVALNAADSARIIRPKRRSK